MSETPTTAERPVGPLTVYEQQLERELADANKLIDCLPASSESKRAIQGTATTPPCCGWWRRHDCSMSRYVAARFACFPKVRRKPRQAQR